MILPRYRSALVACFLIVAALSGCATVDQTGEARPAEIRAAAAPPGSDADRAAAGSVQSLDPDPPSGSGSAAPAALAGTWAPPGPAATAPVDPDDADRTQAQADRASLAARSEPVPPPPAHADLWARIRSGFAMPELDSPLVAQKERFYLARPEYLQRMFARGSRYLHFIVEEIERRGMPTEIALLPFVESAMNPVALSHAQAAGLWQFIPATGRRYELSQDWWVDERRDVVRSTHAALDYLQTIHAMHGDDWFLALASYNWGENAVARAVRANRAKGLPTDYPSLRMPAETRHYVPKLIALKHIVLHADEMGVSLPELPDEPYFTSITKTRPIDLKLAAQFAEMSVDEFIALNPSHNRPVIAASGSERLQLPMDRVERFTRALERHVASGRPLATWQPYTLRRGESIADVARRAGIGTSELLRANGLHARARVLAGSRLLVPQTGISDESRVRSFDGPRVYTRVRTPAVYHRVRKGETLASVARRHGVSVKSLRHWNGGVRSARVGARLVVRPAATRTVLSTPDGDRAGVIRTSTRAAPAPAARHASPRRATSAAGRAAPTPGPAKVPARPAARPIAPAPARQPPPRVRT